MCALKNVQLTAVKFSVAAFYHQHLDGGFCDFQWNVRNQHSNCTAFKTRAKFLGKCLCDRINISIVALESETKQSSHISKRRLNIPSVIPHPISLQNHFNANFQKKRNFSPQKQFTDARYVDTWQCWGGKIYSSICSIHLSVNSACWAEQICTGSGCGMVNWLTVLYCAGTPKQTWSSYECRKHQGTGATVFRCWIKSEPLMHSLLCLVHIQKVRIWSVYFSSRSSLLLLHVDLPGGLLNETEVSGRVRRVCMCLQKSGRGKQSFNCSSKKSQENFAAFSWEQNELMLLELRGVKITQGLFVWQSK